MALVRTRNCVLAVKLFTFLAILSCVTDFTGAQNPSLDPKNDSIIRWGELPPVPMATNVTPSGSRPSTLAAMAEGFVDIVQPSGLPLDYIQFALETTVYNDTSYYEDNWQTEMWKIMGLFVGIIVCVLFGILYFIIVPITGLIFSCCRCCDRCGGKRVQRETKHMGCKRVTLTLFFFSFTGIIW
nr:prominin-1-like [Lytechinus pictus]